MKKLLLAVFCLPFLALEAQPSRQMVNVEVVPHAMKYDYACGEPVSFDARVKVSGIPVSCEDVHYAISEDMMEPSREGDAALGAGHEALIEGGTMKKPGFLRCEVKASYGGKEYSGCCTVGFSPEKLLPIVRVPDDFDRFWQEQLSAASKVPMSPHLELVPASCTDKVDVYHLSLGAVAGNCRVYGMLCVPKGDGKYPAVLKVPGAGVHAFKGDVNTAQNGFITLEIGIHGIPVNLPQSVYDALANGSLNGYPSMNLNSRYDYYYRRVYLSCVRAAEYLASLPQYDGKNLFVAGGSQGGALSIVTAALCPQVKAIMAFYPALCDMEGYLHGRAGGWPHYFRAHSRDVYGEACVRTASYYDVANFARRLEVPCYMSFGYNDMVCPPSTTYSTFNVIPSEKKLLVVEETGHFNYPEQWNIGWDWMMQFKQ